MHKRSVKIASDATETHGAGICIISEQGESTRYYMYRQPHSYGSNSADFEMRNCIKALKIFKKYLDEDDIVHFYCDNAAIESEYGPALELVNQANQLEKHIGCTIDLIHDTIDGGNKYVKAADYLSKGKVDHCETVLRSFGAISGTRN